MRRDHDERFAKQAIQTGSLTPAQVMECRDVLAELESAGVTKLLAAVAVDQGVLSREAAARIVAAINQKAPGAHPPLPGDGAPVPKTPRRPTARVAPPKSHAKLFLIVGAVAAVLIVAAVAILASGESPKETAKAPPPPPVVPEP